MSFVPSVEKDKILISAGAVKVIKGFSASISHSSTSLPDALAIMLPSGENATMLILLSGVFRNLISLPASASYIQIPIEVATAN